MIWNWRACDKKGTIFPLQNQMASDIDWGKAFLQIKNLGPSVNILISLIIMGKVEMVFLGRRGVPVLSFHCEICPRTPQQEQFYIYFPFDLFLIRPGKGRL